MGDAQQPSGPMRNLIVSSTPQGGHEGHEQSVAPEQQIPVTFSISPDPYVTSHPVAGDLGMAVQLVQHPQGYHFNQPQYVQGPPFLPQRSHSTPHYQPTQTVRNAANVPRALPLHPQIQQVVHIPPNSRGFQAGHPPPGIAYQLSHQVHQYQGGSVSPNGQYFVPGHQHTLVGSYGQQYTQVFTQHRDPQAQAQSGSYAVSYSSYPPHYPPSAGPTQEQFPPWCAVEINPHYLVPPQYVAHQIPAQQLPRPHQGQAPPGPYVRRHSFPPRQLPPKRQVSGSETTGATQFVGYPGVPRWDGRAANATAAGPGIGAGGGGGGDAATGGYSELSVRGPGQRYRPSTLPPPQLELSQPNSSAETSGVLASAKTPGTLYSPLPSSSSLPHPALPRGPPRKPKQSGHALWVGNLPTGARVVDLKEYFSKDAKNDIESVFLISRSNCAFVNYRTEEACSAAMIRFHDSRFQNTKLVCRLRRNSAPSAAAGVVAPILSLGPSAHPARDSGDEGTGVGEAEEDKAGGAKSPPAGPKVTARNVGKDRIFIVKSLTVEDLDMSVRTGIWATQGHNESTLNQAFETTDNVYLIFSANKSGEYYGYARMTSPILDDPTDIEWSPSSQSQEDSDLPRAIYTPETALAPQGRIIDDSARGTIFWEAISDDEVPDPIVTTSEGDGNHQKSPVAVARAFGKPFRVEWISTTRVPFYRTKGLRNIWNANREVKIARDGTELEENVGKKLIQIFHRNGNGAVPGNQNTPATILPHERN